MKIRKAKRKAKKILEPLFKQVTPEVETSVDDLAQASGRFVRNQWGRYELIVREDKRREVDLPAVIWLLGFEAEREGLFIDMPDRKTFVLHRIIEPGTPIDVHEIKWFDYLVRTENRKVKTDYGSRVEPERFVQVQMARGRFRVSVTPPDKVASFDVDEEILEILSCAIEAGKVCDWEWVSDDDDDPNPTFWDLNIIYRDGSRFKSRGYGQLPDGHIAFMATLLRRLQWEWE